MAYCPDYIFLGRYQGKWLYELVDYERNDRVYLWDADTGEKPGYWNWKMAALSAGHMG